MGRFRGRHIQVDKGRKEGVILTGKGDAFTSKWGLLLAALGAAIGTGNIWRFPKEVANNGGGSFMIPYVIFLFSWSIPILLVEFTIGKKSRKGTMGSFGAFLGEKKVWMGAWMAWVSTAIGFYYAVVMGWTIRYAVGAASGTISFVNPQGTWDGFLQSPMLVIALQVASILITAAIVYRGVEKGVERINNILIPVLFVMLLFNMIFALTLPGSLRGISYLFTPGKELFQAKTWVSALAQSAWSCSAGMGMAITYGSYTRRKHDTNLNTFLTGFGDTSVSLIAGIMIFSTVFALSGSMANATAAVEEGGSGLTFIHLPNLFGKMWGGGVIAFFFFLAMSFAALTSMISTYEAAIRNFVDAGWKRTKAIFVLSVGMILFGLPSALIILPVGGRSLPVFLDHQDHIWGMGLLLSGFFIYYLVYKYGVSRFRENLINSKYSDLKIGRWFDILFKYVIPIELTFLVVWYIIQSAMADPWDQWWMSGPVGLVLIAIEWGVAIMFLRWISSRVGHKVSATAIDMGRPLEIDADMLGDDDEVIVRRPEAGAS